ncbi:type IV pilin [Halogeometricum pallidum]|nr:type IV pilin N-terminal domain-containing protein [Halogeometricum pallidum]
MKLFETFRTDDRAVSPVLGVALLIAMTVILAGVVGYVALGVDADSANAPQVSLKFKQDADAGTVTMYHKGGDALAAGEVIVKTDNASADPDDPGALATGDSYKVVTVGATTGDVVSIVWQDPSSDREVLLAEYTVE